LIIVECNNDETLVKVLGIKKKDIDHQPGKSRVIKALLKDRGRLGIVDSDPGKSQPKECLSFNRIEETQDLTLLCKGNAHLCVIYPDLEGWIIKRAKLNHYDLKEYDIPDTAQDMHKVPDLHLGKGYTELLERLFKEDEEFALLSKWVRKFI